MSLSFMLRTAAALGTAVNAIQAALVEEHAVLARPELTLQNEVVSAARESLGRGAERRRAVTTPAAWETWRRQTLATLRAAFPEAVFAKGRPLQARVVSRHEFDGYRIENVLFESLPGWEVNASLYLPPEPGVYPGVVCPTGHSTKTGRDYQRSAQVLARNGYVVASFDPPGCAGEIAALNDHFTNGLVGYLTGFWSQSHFVVDALRCLDYLETRPDVDSAAGFTVTGVSGGGLTSLFTGMLDERVAFIAPVCCLAEHESIHLTGLYTSCPEQFGPGYLAAGLDYVDYVASLAPRPCLIVGGKQDEVFLWESTARLHAEAQQIYGVAGRAEDCGLFIDEDSGHAYTVAMANEVVRWMNRIIKQRETPPRPLTEADVQTADRERLLCHPSNDVNMFTINRDEAVRLKAARRFPADPAERRRQLQAAAAEILNVSPDVQPFRVVPRSAPRRSWHAQVEEVDIQPMAGVHLPALMLTHVEDKSPRPGLLWIDERGHWAALRQGGFLSRPLRLFDPDCGPNQPRILSVDVSGLGQLTPEPTAYDLAGWNDIERILTYLSIANARPIMGLRVRDALGALAYLRSRPEVDPQRLMVGGRGVGALVALHTALLAGVGSTTPSPQVRRVLCLDMLSHYGSFTEKFPFQWRPSVIIPGLLPRYDLPDLLPALSVGRELPSRPVFVINPVDAQQKALSQEEADALYAEGLAAGAVVRCGVDGESAVVEAIESGW